MSNNNDEGSGMKQLLMLIGGLAALALIIQNACLIVETYIKFLPEEGTIINILYYIKEYAPLVLMLSVGLSVVWDQNGILKLVVLVACAAIIICRFLPGVQETIESYIGVKPLS